MANIWINAANDFRAQAAAKGRLNAEFTPDQGNGGAVVVQNEGNGIGGKLCSWISKLPLLRRMLSETPENRNTLNTFLEALTNVYGEKAADKAASMIDKGHVLRAGLSARNARKMLNAAETYQGSGNAKNLSRNVTMRIWPYESKSHPGHAAVDLKNRDLKTRHYVSWWPNETNRGKRDGMLSLKTPDMQDSKSDKTAELGSATAEKLERGMNARAYLQRRTGLMLTMSEAQRATLLNKPDDQLNDLEAENKQLLSLSPETLREWEDAAKYVPRPGQERKVGEKDWGMRPMKICLPLLGESVERQSKVNDRINPQPGQKRFNLFGLSEKGIQSANRELRAKAAWMDAGRLQTGDAGLGYRFLSKTNNCAGKALEILKAGGSEALAPAPKALLYLTPNDVSAYSERLQRTVDTLNSKVDLIRGKQADNAEDALLATELEHLSDADFLNRVDQLVGGDTMSASFVEAATHYLGTDSREPQQSIMNSAAKMVGAMDASATGRTAVVFREMIRRTESHLMEANTRESLSLFQADAKNTLERVRTLEPVPDNGLSIAERLKLSNKQVNAVPVLLNKMNAGIGELDTLAGNPHDLLIKATSLMDEVETFQYSIFSEPGTEEDILADVRKLAGQFIEAIQAKVSSIRLLAELSG